MIFYSLFIVLASLLSQCWLVLEVQVPLDTVLVACHRFKRTQDTVPA